MSTPRKNAPVPLPGYLLEFLNDPLINRSAVIAALNNAETADKKMVSLFYQRLKRDSFTVEIIDKLDRIMYDHVKRLQEAFGDFDSIDIDPE
jgi:hypothetical protein